jgi:fructan beta-fructosidase
VHYSPPSGRLADPCGLVWYQGEWHLFHQQMGTWAHAVSSDLLHWETLAVALEHDSDGQALTGGTVVDGADTSDLFAGSSGLVTLYTSTQGGQGQSLAYSSDRGRTWSRYDHNPVLPNDGRPDFRDPAVFWHEPSHAWVMALAVGDAVEFFRSPDLRTWTFASRFGEGQGTHAGVWECPDLFPLLVDDDPGRTLWVLHVSVGANPQTAGSTAQYFLGSFDGTTFSRDLLAENVQDPTEWLLTDVGQDFYAARTWQGAPGGRRVMLAWMGNWDYPYSAPTQGWTNSMSLPRELALRTVGDGVRLVQWPVAELESLRGAPWSPEVAGAFDGELELEPSGGATAGAYEVLAELALADAAAVGLRVHAGSGGTGTLVTASHDRVVLDRTRGGRSTLPGTDGGPEVAFATRRDAQRVAPDDVVRLRVVVDTSSVEAFIDDGTTVGTMVLYPDPGATGLALVAEGGSAIARSVAVLPLALE